MLHKLTEKILHPHQKDEELEKEKAQKPAVVVQKETEHKETEYKEKHHKEKVNKHEVVHEGTVQREIIVKYAV
jgi:hypothetical protein